MTINESSLVCLVWLLFCVLVVSLAAWCFGGWRSYLSLWRQGAVDAWRFWTGRDPSP